MSNIVRVRITIKGVRPLLMHHFGPDALPLEKQEKDGVAGNSPNEWRKTALVTKDGQLYLPPTYAFATIRDAARHTKKGKGSIQSAVAATLQVLDNNIPLDRYLPGFLNGHAFDINAVEPPPRDESAPVYLDVQSVRTRARGRVTSATGWQRRRGGRAASRSYSIRPPLTATRCESERSPWKSIRQFP